jgi:tetratricopeptide (TPR) repeat protein
MKFLSRLFGEGQRDVARTQTSELAPMAQPAKALDPDAFLNDVQARFRRTEELFAAGKGADATALAQQTVVFIERSLGPQHSTGAELMGFVAGILEKHDAAAEAERCYLRALSILEKNGDPNDRRLTEVVTRFGWFYLRQNRFAEAEIFFKRSLAASERDHGPDSGMTSLALQNLAKVYQGQGRMADAKVLFDRIAVNRANRFKS